MQEKETGQRLHQRETLTQILLPLVLGLALIIGAFLLAALAGDPEARGRASIAANLMVSFICLLPLLLCSSSGVLLVAVLIYGMNKLHDGTERPLRKLENLVSSLADKVENFSQTVNQRSIRWSAKLEQIFAFTKIFDTDTKKEEDNGGSK